MSENDSLKKERILRWPDVEARVRLSRSHINSLIRKGRFPPNFSLTSGRSVG